jgi:hypothetical protein
MKNILILIEKYKGEIECVGKIDVDGGGYKAEMICEGPVGGHLMPIRLFTMGNTSKLALARLDKEAGKIIKQNKAIQKNKVIHVNFRGKR